ncbi:MAG TPA: polyprenol monophosphomannose synthase [Acidimicrobiales bacterium]|nr:polyprenol monophosphomannose synthase [Acidimicrobiales bacterium]
MERTLIVLPTYEEALNIDEALRRVRAAAPHVDVLVVDDNSPDGTADIARSVAADLGQIDVVVRARKDGLGNAYRHGFRIGFERGYEVLMQMDADLSHAAADIPRLLEKLDRGADLVIGSRYVPGGSVPHWAWYRRAMSRYGNRYACFVLGLSIHDATAGFRAYRADTLKAIDVFSTRAKGYGFQIETAYRVSRQSRALDEVPIVFTDRIRGASKMSPAVMSEEMLLVTWWGIRDRLLPQLRRRTK